MPAPVTDYKCPACTAPLRYSEHEGVLVCDHCDSRLSIEQAQAFSAEKERLAAEAFDAEMEAILSAPPAWEGAEESPAQWGDEAAGLVSCTCPSCGAELICAAATAATCCPYCGNNAILPGRFTGARRPDLVIPFAITREEALAAVRRHYQGKALLPRAFQEEHHIQELTGVYVPFWLFDGEVDADVHFDATHKTVQRIGQNSLITTKHFSLRRAGTVQFEKIPVDASRRMPDDYMDAIEPFSYDALRPFSTAYLPGFAADVPDVPIEQCVLRAKERAQATAVEAMRSQVQGYDTCAPTRQTAHLRRGTVRCALLPVWMLTTRWNGQSYVFAMNGQSGKVACDLPVCRRRYWACWAAASLAATALGAIGLLVLNAL